jgi:zinc transporter ZupT
MVFALLLGLLTTGANILGSYLAALQRRPSRSLMANSIAFGGGFILAAALLEMVPESLERGAFTPAFVALGYLLVYLTEHLLHVHLHQIPPDSADPPSAGAAHTVSAALVPAGVGLAALVAFNIHDFIDGLAIGSGMMASPALGVLVFLAVLLHEVPAGFVIGAIMRGAGQSRLSAVLAGVSIGVVTLLGIAIPFLVGGVSPVMTGVFLALAAGTFVYLGASILIPVAETGGYRGSFLYVALGFLAFYGSSELVGLFLG